PRGRRCRRPRRQGRPPPHPTRYREPDAPATVVRANPPLGERMSVLGSAPWRRAPLLLRRSPAVLLAVLAAGLILGTAAAATPLFLTSVANAALTRQLADRCPPTYGLQVRAAGALGGPLTAEEAQRAPVL